MAEAPFLAVEGLSAFYGTRPGARGRDLRDGQGVHRDRGPQRHGQDDALQRDHGHLAAARARLDPLRGPRDPRQVVEQDREPRRRLRPAGPAALPLAQRRRAPPDDPRPQDRRAAHVDAAEHLRALPASRGAQAERRRPAVGRRAADARDRPRAADEPEAPGHGRALRGARARDHREPDRGLQAPRGGGARDPPDRAEPRRGDVARDPAARHGRRARSSPRRRPRSSPPTPTPNAASSGSSRWPRPPSASVW